MSKNKNAVLRYNVLDKCFQNIGRKYYFQDLLDVVNEALLEENPKSAGIQTRQLRDDIRFMKSNISGGGYSAPIVTIREGKKAYYRYSDPKFSINQRPLNSTEAEQLKNAISILQRFEGSPEFEWVNELAPMLNDQFGLKNESKKVMGYDSNIDYIGYKYITPLFNAIVNERVLEIKYQPFGKSEQLYQFHPYYLKQYINRWFILGKSNFDFESYQVLALDRILDIQEVAARYKVNNEDWDSYFYDMIGVSKPPEAKVEEVKLLFSKEQTPYVETKPLHPSQKSTVMENGELLVRLNLIINYELETKLLSFGEKVKVIAPKSLQTIIASRIAQAIKKY